MLVIVGERDISIHVPREGDDSNIVFPSSFLLLFQSTSPARGTTTSDTQIIQMEAISIHVPREGDDSGLMGKR